jgi:hypothetical protein
MIAEEDDKQFSSIKEALKGTTILETPRVSREVQIILNKIFLELFFIFFHNLTLTYKTIISILGTHTDLLKSLRKVLISA